MISIMHEAANASDCMKKAIVPKATRGRRGLGAGLRNLQLSSCDYDGELFDAASAFKAGYVSVTLIILHE